MFSKVLTFALIGIFIGQMVGSIATASPGTPPTTELIGTKLVENQYIEWIKSWCVINDEDSFKVSMRARRVTGIVLWAWVGFEVWIFAPGVNYNNNDDAKYTQYINEIGTGQETSTRDSNDFMADQSGIWNIKIRVTLLRNGVVQQETWVFQLDFADTLSPNIELSKVNGNEVSPAIVNIIIKDQTNIDTYSYKLIRDSDNAEIIPETLVDIPNARTYVTSLSWTLDFLGIGTFTAYVKAKDTLGYESDWSSIGFAMYGDDDVDSPTITFTYNTKNMFFGNGWSDCIPDKSLGWTVSDPSGLYSVAVYPIVNGIMGDLFSTSASGTFPIPNGAIGSYALYVEATDNDFDNGNPLDRSSGSATSNTKFVVDDDTTGPDISITDLTIPTGEPATVIIAFSITDLGGILSYWSDTFIPYPIYTPASGVSQASAYLERDGEIIRIWNDIRGLNFVSFSAIRGNYHFHIDATNGDNDRPNDSESSFHDIYFVITDDDESGPTIMLVAEEVPFVGAVISYTIYDISGIMEWSLVITRNGEFYLSDGATYSSPNYIPVVGGLTITERGQYHIVLTAIDGDMDYEGDQSITISEADVTVHDWTAPVITYQGDFDQTDANPQIVNVTITDPESGLKSIYILFGMKLDVLNGWNPLSGLLELDFLGIDILSLLDADMIWIPVRITSEDVIGDLFDAIIGTLLGDYLGSDIVDLIVDAIEGYLGESLEDYLGDVYAFIMDNFGDLIGEGAEWLNEQFASAVTSILGAVYDFVLGLLMDEDFVVGQTTYSYSIDMKYFAWARLFGEFRLLTIAQNTEDLTFLLTTSVKFSNRYALADDDDELSVGNFQIFGDAENLYVTFEENDYSGIAYLITIDNIPILPCLDLYTAEKVGNVWTITFSRCPINILQALGLSDLGTHTMTFYVMDLDSDWLVPYLFDAKCGKFTLSFELVVPEISVLYTGDGTDGNAGQVIFVVNDASPYTVVDGQLINDVMVQIDTPQTFQVHVMDKFGSQACKSFTLQLVDDDTEAPVIVAYYTGDYTDGNAGQVIFTAYDASGIYGSDIMIFNVDNTLIGITQTFTATFTDADMDRANDQLSATASFSVTIGDDDTTAPVILWTYNGDYTDGNSGSIIVSAFDASGLLVDPSGEYAVPNELGTYVFEFTAIDADMDREGDVLSTTISVSITIVDDDTNVDIAGLSISHTLNFVTINFVDIDLSGITSCDWVMVDGNYVAFTYSDGTISFANIWNLQMGNHQIYFQLTDGDNDRLNDATSAIFSIVLTITEYDVVAWADAELEELIQMCMDCDSWLKKNGEKTIINKINEVIALKEAGKYMEAYNKLLHDIKPKLTGVKVDELGNSFGKPDFKNAWVSQGCFAAFNAQINSILAALHLLF